MRVFKRLFLMLVVSLSLFSCKTTECYYTDGTEIFVINDTIVLPSFHQHTESDGNKYCLYVEEMKWHCVDTIEVERIKCKKVLVRTKK